MKYFLFILIFSVTSCGTSTLNVDHTQGSLRFLSPETQGKPIVLQAQSFIGVSNQVSMARTSQSFVLGSASELSVDKRAEIEGTNDYGLQGQVGVLKRWDMFLEVGTDTPTNIGSKVQILGSPRLERKKGFKLAIQGSVGFLNDDESNTEKFMTNTSSKDEVEDIKAITEVRKWDVGILTGFRLSKSALVYKHIYYGTSHIDSKIGIYNGSSPFRLEQRFRLYGGLLGLQLDFQGKKLSPENGGIFVRFETGYSKMESLLTDIKQDHFVAGLGIGLSTRSFIGD